SGTRHSHQVSHLILTKRAPQATLSHTCHRNLIITGSFSTKHQAPGGSAMPVDTVNPPEFHTREQAREFHIDLAINRVPARRADVNRPHKPNTPSERRTERSQGKAPMGQKLPTE
ncbi:hypothetical protein, partial [Saccharopolyspora shandongensis]|uniref:hypothetical protein n=1 Tax=Saccharopolyspora shandongensis TaxID=418495 RepID=UPI0033CD2039